MTFATRYRYPLGISAAIHAVVLLGGFSLLYHDAEFGVAPGGGATGAKLVSWQDMQSELDFFKPAPAAPKEFVLPKKAKPKPPAQPKRGDAPVEGSPGSGEGFGRYTSQPRYFRNPLPPYPRDLRLKGVEGEVLLAVQLDKRGRVTRVEVIQSSGYDAFDRSAVETIQRRWRFRPARIGALKVESMVRVPIVFEIKR